MAESQRGGAFGEKGCPYCGSDRVEVQIRLASDGQMDSSGVHVTCKQCGRQLTLDNALAREQAPAETVQEGPAETVAPATLTGSAGSEIPESRPETARAPSGAVMESSAGSDAVLEAARADVYRMNAFRVTQLPVNATTREIARQTEKFRVLEKLGATPTVTGALALDPPPDQHSMREALQRLRDPERRLVDELFWFWPQELGQGRPDEALDALRRGEVQSAARGWLQKEREGSESNVSMHNLAVLSHATALDLEGIGGNGQLPDAEKQKRDRCWSEALTRWRTLLDHEGFWSRLTARIRELDDPRLTTGTVRRMRASLPLTLLTINARLAVQAAEAGNTAKSERHAGILRDSGFAAAVVEAALRRALEPVRSRVQTLCKAADADGDADVEHADQVAWRLKEQTEPLLRVLDGLLPAGNPMRDGAHDEVALRALGCQIQHGNKTENWKASKELLEATLPIAASASAKGRIQENLRIISTNLENERLYGTCFFCKESKPEDSAALEVKMFGDVERTPTYQGSRITWKHGTIKVPRCAECRAAHDGEIRWWAWYLFAFFLWFVGAPMGLIRFIPRFRLNPTPSLGRFLGFCTGVLFMQLFWIVMDISASANHVPPMAADVGLRMSANMAVWIGTLLGGGWYGKSLRLKRGLPEHSTTNSKGRPTLPEKQKKDYPPIQDRLKKGWQFGAQPVG